MHLRFTHVRPFLTIALVALLVVPSAVSAAGRITGGTKVDQPAYDSTWRSLVSIEGALNANLPASQAARQQCNGVLIAPTLVLTAAYCIGVEYEYEYPVPPDTLMVVGGTSQLSTDYRTLGARVRVSEVIMNPRGDRLPNGEAHFSTDLAMLRIERPIPGAVPARVAARADADLWGNGSGKTSGIQVAGWHVDPEAEGVDGLRQPSSVARTQAVKRTTPSDLEVVELPVIAQARCLSDGMFFSDYYETFDPHRDLCLGQSKPMRGACEYDTGGPVMARDSIGAPVVVGILHFAYSDEEYACHVATHALRVDVADAWIESVVQQVDAGIAGPLAPTDVAARMVRKDVGALSWTHGPSPVVRNWLGRWEQRVVTFPKGKNGKPVRPAIKFDFQDTIGSVDGAVSSASLDRVAPVRARVPAGYRVAVEDGFGRMTWSPRSRFEPPIDSKRPTKPGRPVERGERLGVPLLKWSGSKDNDCVQSYVVSFKLEGAKSWEIGRTVYRSDCGSARERSYMRQQPLEAALFNFEPGTYVVRIAALDRAGNTAYSPQVRVAVKRKVADRDYDLSACELVAEQIVCTYPLVPSEDASGRPMPAQMPPPGAG